MTKSITRMMLVAAVGSMVALPVAAQANTRASDSRATYTASADAPAGKAKPGLSRKAKGEKQAETTGILLGVLGAAAGIAGIAAAAGAFSDNDDDDQSPGT